MFCIIKILTKEICDKKSFDRHPWRRRPCSTSWRLRAHDSWLYFPPVLSSISETLQRPSWRARPGPLAGVNAGQRRRKSFRSLRSFWWEQRGVGGMDDGHEMQDESSIFGDFLWYFIHINNPCVFTVCWKPVCSIFPVVITCITVFNLYIYRGKVGLTYRNGRERHLQ